MDGDTIRISPPVDGLDTIRLIGIDTPETKDPRTGVQPYGEEASAFARAVLEEKRVGLEFDVEKVDRYGRLLAYVWMPGGEMINEVLLREGYAQVATFPPNVKYIETFLAAQEQARTEGRGLWGLSEEELCELADRGNGIGGGCEALEPGEPEPDLAPGGRAGVGSGATAPVSENTCPQSHPIKGNHSSSGELIYHVSGGQFYDATNPEECFASEGDARAAGYRASQR